MNYFKKRLDKIEIVVIIVGIYYFLGKIAHRLLTYRGFTPENSMVPLVVWELTTINTSSANNTANGD